MTTLLFAATRLNQPIPQRVTRFLLAVNYSEDSTYRPKVPANTTLAEFLTIVKKLGTDDYGTSSIDSAGNFRLESIRNNCQFMEISGNLWENNYRISRWIKDPATGETYLKSLVTVEDLTEAKNIFTDKNRDGSLSETCAFENAINYLIAEAEQEAAARQKVPAAA